MQKAATICSINDKRIQLLSYYKCHKQFSLDQILERTNFKQDKSDIYFLKAVIAAKNKAYSIAIDYFYHCIYKHVDDTLSYLLLADILYKTRRPFEALSILKTSLAPCKHHHRLTNSMGIGLRHIQSNQKAAYYFLQSIEKRPHYLPALDNLIQLYLDEKNYHLAIPLLKRKLLLQPKRKSIIKKIGYCYLQIGSAKEAIAWYKKHAYFYKSEPIKKKFN